MKHNPLTLAQDKIERDEDEVIGHQIVLHKPAQHVSAK